MAAAVAVPTAPTVSQPLLVLEEVVVVVLGVELERPVHLEQPTEEAAVEVVRQIKQAAQVALVLSLSAMLIPILLLPQPRGRLRLQIQVATESIPGHRLALLPFKDTVWHTLRL